MSGMVHSSAIRWFARLLVAVAVSLLVVPHALGQTQEERKRHEDLRETWQRLPDVLRAVGAEPGAQIADVGAGTGFYSIRLARHVGERGRVFAVDLRENDLEEIRRRAAEEQRSNIVTIKGEPVDTKLPESTLDAVLIVACHEMFDHQPMLQAFLRALKPGGRVVMIEPTPKSAETSREAQTKAHRLAIEFAEQDLRDAGFEIIVRTEQFDRRIAEEAHMTDWLLVAPRHAKLLGDC